MSNYSRSDRRRKLNEKKKPVWKKIMKISLIIIGIIIISIVALFTYYIATAPKLDKELLDVPFSSQFLDKDGEVFGDMGAENRIKIEYNDLPEELIDALTATEDARYFEHPGIDVRRIFGAVVGNLKNGFGSEGASTITQQVVENMFLTPEKSIKLKVQEQWLALQLEREYSKEEIMEMYLNKIFFGSNAYGVGKAAEVYFGINDLNELSLVQSAILAGLPQRPSAYNPFENPDLMQGRVNTVLKLMVRHDKITQAEADEAMAVDIPSVLTDKKPSASPYQAFIQKIEIEIEEKLDGAKINSDGLIIHTTLDTKAQKHVEFLLSDSDDNPINYPDDDLLAGMTVVDTQTGAIRAIGGSRDNKGSSGGDNYAFNLKDRQGGSVIKPILAYGPAIEYEKWSTYHQILDEEYTPKGSNPIRNHNRKYHGWVSARYALAQSLNIPAAKTLVEIGSERTKGFAESLGLSFADKTLDPRDAFGGTTSSITPLELAGAYSAFGNEGIYNEPYAVVKVEFPDGSVVDLKSDPEVVMQDYTAYMVTDMLKSVIKTGTGQSADIPGMNIAGKTGTTNGPTDAWFGGYSTNYTIGIWTGYSDNTDLSGEETQIPRALFKETMTELSKDLETPDFTKPDSVVEVAVEKGSNPPALASSNTPSDNIVKELFVKGTEPTEVSETFENLEPVTNLSAKYDEKENTINIEWDYPKIEDSDIEFEVNFKLDDDEFKNFTTTADKQVALLEVDDDVTYTIQVIAIDKENDRKSDPTTTSIQITEVEEEDEDIPAVNNLSVVFNREEKSLDLSWSYDGPPATFEVVINGDQKQTVQTTGVTINGAQPGATYDIVVTAISMENEDNRSKPKSTSITVEENVEEEPEEEPEDSEEPAENEDKEDNEENEDNNNNKNNNKNKEE